MDHYSDKAYLENNAAYIRKDLTKNTKEGIKANQNWIGGSSFTM